MENVLLKKKIIQDQLHDLYAREFHIATKHLTTSKDG